MIGFFDTETTGFVKKDVPPDHPTQARCVQIAAYVTDSEGNVAHEFSAILKPEGFTIPEYMGNMKTEDLHGVTQEVATHFGISRKPALTTVLEMLNMCEVVVAHNFAYDDSILNIESAVHGIPWNPKKTYCTMKATTDFCAIPKAKGYGFKWPKLQELYFKLFNENFEDAHSANADTKAMIRCFFELRKRNIIVGL